MKSVILTGATGGLGSCLATQINELKDLDLICVYRDEKKYQKVIVGNDIICKNHRTSENDTFLTIGDLVSHRADEVVLLLNAFSIEPVKAIGTYSTIEIDSMINGNITLSVRILNSVINYVKEHNLELRIVNLDSGAADFPLKGWGNYCAAKAYINAFLAVIELENPDIRIVSADPGVMDTKMQEVIRETPSFIFDKVNDFIDYKENKVLRDPADVAKFIIDNYVTDWKAEKLREKIVL